MSLRPWADVCSPCLLSFSPGSLAYCIGFRRKATDSRFRLIVHVSANLPRLFKSELKGTRHPSLHLFRVEPGGGHGFPDKINEAPDSHFSNSFD